MRIAIAGGTGFIGAPLASRLVDGNDVAVLTRDPSHVRFGRGVKWNPPEQDAWADIVAAADVVINLAGENIGQRWTKERKERLVSSRLDATNALVEALRTAPHRSRTFISASAVGYYGSRGDDVLDESARPGIGFLPELVMKWEAAARQAEPVARVIILRFGVVLDPHGGALQKMLPPFRLGLGGPIGGGAQWMSWVAQSDVLRFIEWAIGHDDVRGLYNVTSPEPARNREFARALGRALHRPALIPIPSLVVKLLFGQMGVETVLTGQRVIPQRSLAEGFVFESPRLNEALARIV